MLWSRDEWLLALTQAYWRMNGLWRTFLDEVNFGRLMVETKALWPRLEREERDLLHGHGDPATHHRSLKHRGL